MMTPQELELFKRRIVYVATYLDDEHELPCNYVLRTGDGKFEAIATHYFDIPEKEMRERSLGILDDEKVAIKTLQAHLRAVHLAEWEDLRTLDGKLDFNPRTIN